MYLFGFTGKLVRSAFLATPKRVSIAFRAPEVRTPQTRIDMFMTDRSLDKEIGKTPWQVDHVFPLGVPINIARPDVPPPGISETTWLKLRDGIFGDYDKVRKACHQFLWLC